MTTTVGMMTNANFDVLTKIDETALQRVAARDGYRQIDYISRRLHHFNYFPISSTELTVSCPFILRVMEVRQAELHESTLCPVIILLLHYQNMFLI